MKPSSMAFNQIVGSKPVKNVQIDPQTTEWVCADIYVIKEKLGF